MPWIETFQAQNRIKRIYRFAQILLSILFIALLNYLSMNHFARFDLTHQHQYSLSPESRAYLRDLDQPVHFIVTIPENSPREEERTLLRYVDNLLREYSYHSRAEDGPLITVEKVDIYKNHRRADELQRQFGLTQANTVIVQSPARHRFLRPEDIMTFHQDKPTVFKGERAFTSAILEVIQDTAAKIYFLTGHGEMSPQDVSPQRGLSELATELQARNIRVETLDLTKRTKVPDDAGLLVLGDPQGPLLSSEQQKLRSYLNENAGRLMIWIGPGRSHGISALLRDWGIQAEDMIILEQGSDYIEGTGKTLIRQFAEHPVTQSLILNQTFLVSGLTRPIRPDPTAAYDDRRIVTPLMGSSAQSWARKTSVLSQSTPRFEPASDLRGPVPIAIASERRSASQLGINIQGGRLLVFGSSDLFSNQQLASLGNIQLFFNSLNWMLDRDQLLAIPPRNIETYQLTASRSELRRITLWFISPAASVALMGFLVFWIRKI